MVTDKDSEDKLAKVRFNCRRGMLELDMMLQNFFDSTYASLTREKQDLFEALLGEEDQDLFNWLMGKDVCPKVQLQDMLMVIRHLHTMAHNSEIA